MQEVADGVYRFDSHRLVNWYLVADAAGTTAVDAGLPPDARTLRAALRRLGRRLDAVVLTHGHVDHVGFCRAVRKAGVPVYVHEADVAIARRPLPMAASESSPLLYLRYPAGRHLMATALLTLAPAGQWIDGLATYREGDALPVPGSPRAVFTPGHTDGHCALHLPERNLVFSGDALVTSNPYTGRPGPQIVARAATKDSAPALASLDALAETGARLVLPGHGDPWDGGAAEAAAQARAAGPS